MCESWCPFVGELPLLGIQGVTGVLGDQSFWEMPAVGLGFTGSGI